MFDEILDYRKLVTAIGKKVGSHIRHNGNGHEMKATKGYEFHVSWKERNTKRIPLKDVYASNPLETAEFTVACTLYNKLTFMW